MPGGACAWVPVLIAPAAAAAKLAFFSAFLRAFFSAFLAAFATLAGLLPDMSFADVAANIRHSRISANSHVGFRITSTYASLYRALSLWRFSRIFWRHELLSAG